MAKKDFGNLPGLKTFQITQEFEQSELGQQMEHEREEEERLQRRSTEVMNSFIQNAQRAQQEEINRQKAGLEMQYEAHVEARRQTELAEEALKIAKEAQAEAKITRILTAIAVGIACVSLGLSVLSLFK